ncbi:MAG: M23 family metallopeptidase [Acidobacteria bacterium]|nr:M23 family metallopeptidase [Acidobacteriota bacterium]
MANEFYTLIVVPHAKARFRKIQVSVRFAKWVGGVGGVLALIVAGILVHYTWISAEVYDLRHLRSQNAELLARTHEYEKDAAVLQNRVQDLQRMVNKLGVMAGLEQSLPDPSIGGVGGVPSRDSVAPSVDLKGMAQEVTTLAERSARIEEFYKDQKVLLGSTPSIWPVRGYLSAGFGNRLDPFTNQWDFHSGIDVSTPVGTPVRSPADGVVIAVGAKGGYGNAISVNHSFGMITQYGHLDRFNVRPGQRVRRGDVIGFVGQTGRATGPHLHYEVWVRDQAQNPIHFILDEYRSFG